MSSNQQHQQQNYLSKKVKAVLAVPTETVKVNIKKNLEQIPNWLDAAFYPNGFEAIVISAGPSMEKYVKELNIKERMSNPNRGFVVFAVKHAYPRLLEMGIEPDFCVMLDGRPFNADSTHGKNRKDLFKKISNKTIHMVASMAHPDYGKYLIENGARVLGWHTSVQGLDEFGVQGPIVSGGTSSGTRCISVANLLGIRSFTLVGFDSCVLEYGEKEAGMKDSKGRPLYIPTDLPVMNPVVTDKEKGLLNEIQEEYHRRGYVYNGTLNKRFWTTGELLAQAQDFETLFQDPSLDLQFKIFDDGIVSHMFENLQYKPKRGFSFIEYMSNKAPRKYHTNEVPRRKVVTNLEKLV